MPKKIKEPIWTTKSGEKIPISKMEDLHLLNTIALLQRKHEAYLLTMPYPYFQGEMAQMCAEAEWDAAQDSSVEEVFPVFLHLYEEAHKRRILPEQRDRAHKLRRTRR